MTLRLIEDMAESDVRHLSELPCHACGESYYTTIRR